MKKLILTPQKDTMTICLPHDWVGKPLVCILKHPDEIDAYPIASEFVSALREDTLGYNASKLKYQRKRKPRKKRLRKRRGSAKKLL